MHSNIMQLVVVVYCDSHNNNNLILTYMNRLFKPNKKHIQTPPGGGALIIAKIMFGAK